MILGAIGFMFGTGGSALIAKTMGEGNNQKANRLFSFFVYCSTVLGIVISVMGIIFIRPIAAYLGAEGKMLEDCVLYGRIILLANPAFILQMEFQTFFITAEKPQFGLYVTLASGVTNMVLDAIFVAVFKWGIVGAALATGFSQVVGGIVPIIYFLRPNSSLLKLSKTNFDLKALLKACTNGSSELMSNISMSLVSMLYNVQLIKYAGENGVASYGVLMYVNFVFISAFIGYSIGTAPVIGFHYGAKNHYELKSILKKSIVIISICSFTMLIISEVMAVPLAKIFVGYDVALYEMTRDAFIIFSFSFLFAGFCIFGSSLFTALNNGLISAVISFMRTLIFQIAAVLILPLILGLDGIWCSVVLAEILAFIVTAVLIWVKRNEYKYL